MRRIRLGRTQARVSAIAIGTWSHGGPRSVGGHEVGWSGHDDRQARAALERAFEVGIDHFDTADVYGAGRAERLIGGLWTRLPRERIFLASKVGWDPGPHDHYYHPEQVRRQLEASLRNLATDWIDLYYLHHADFGPGARYLDDALAVLHRARDAGKIRHIGLSDWDGHRLMAVIDRVDPDVVQPYRNLLDDDFAASGLASRVAAHDLGVAFFSPLKHGLLLGKYERPTTFAAGDMRNEVPGFRDAAVLAHLRACRAAVERRFAAHPQPLLHALTGPLLADTSTASVLLGLRNVPQVEAAAHLGEPLSPADAEWVRQLYRAQSAGPRFGA